MNIEVYKIFTTNITKEVAAKTRNGIKNIIHTQEKGKDKGKHWHILLSLAKYVEQNWAAICIYIHRLFKQHVNDKWG